MTAIQFNPFDLIITKNLKLFGFLWCFWLPSMHDRGHSGNVPCTLNQIYTVLLNIIPVMTWH